MNIIRVAPFQFIHVLDSNTNVTRVVEGPLTYTKKDHEKVVLESTPMVTVPPRYFCKIKNPVSRDANGELIQDKFGAVKLRFGDEEYRFEGEPFPLYPGEVQVGGIERIRIVERNQALKLRAIRDVTIDEEEKVAGDEWYFLGPGSFTPIIEVEVVDLIKATVIYSNQALLVKAIRDCMDDKKNQRKAGEMWLIREPGSYLPGINEQVVEVLHSQILTDKIALHVVAEHNFTDFYGVKRKAGDEWLITKDLTESHIKDVHEKIKGIVHITTLNSSEYAIVENPWVDDIQKLGSRVLRKGEISFFLRPGECLLDNEVKKCIILQDDEALLLKAREEFTDFEDETQEGSEENSEKDVKMGTLRKPGDIWMVFGPRKYFPGVEIEIKEKRKAIPLDKNEGIYVRNTKSGEVKAIIGETYLLSSEEVLWEKEVSTMTEALLAKQSMGQVFVPPAVDESDGGQGKTRSKKRDKTKVIDFRVPQNAAVKLYNFKARKSRVVFGPELLLLEPDEQFTVLNLSGDKPKRPGVIQSLALMLGPDFMTDIIIVETSDHCRLRLTLAYNWVFKVRTEEEKKQNSSKIFSVRDHVADCCKAIASRIRGAVACETFETFHQYSAKIIRGSVFGINSSGKVGESLCFEANQLLVTNIDIQSIEPVDQTTRESLQKSVQLAIEITTESQEANARHVAKEKEEVAKGALVQKQIRNETEAELERKKLLEMRANSSAVETLGKARAEAEARTIQIQIEAEAKLSEAKLIAEAKKIQTEAELDALVKRQEAELAHKKQMMALEIEKEKEKAKLKRELIQCIGSDTIADIARAGPETQAKILSSLGLKGYLVTDGKNPINLFSTAKGMIGSTSD